MSTTLNYSSFTDRSRKVMQLANQEAQRLNHEYIGTEHVLVGMIKEGSGVAANAMKNLGLSLESIRAELDKVIKPGPEMITMGKMPQTPRVRSGIERAMQEAARLGHHYVGTEHLLLGFIGDPEGVFTAVIETLGISSEEVRSEVEFLLGVHTPKQEKPAGNGPFDEIERLQSELASVTAERDELRKQVLQWQPISECDQCVIDEQYILLTVHFDSSIALALGFAQVEDDAIVFEDENGEEIEEPSYFMPLSKFPIPTGEA